MAGVGDGVIGFFRGRLVALDRFQTLARFLAADFLRQLAQFLVVGGVHTLPIGLELLAAAGNKSNSKHQQGQQSWASCPHKVLPDGLLPRRCPGDVVRHAFQDVVDDAVFLRFARRHEFVAVGVLFDSFQRLPRVPQKNVVELLLEPSETP